MKRKFLILALILILFLSGCVKEKTEKEKKYKIELDSYSVDFENEKINLELYSEKELPKTRLEIVDETKKVKCFDYFDLKKGKNNFSIYCPGPETTKKLSVEITPSNGTTKEFKIQVTPKKRITLKKGFKYHFNFKSAEHNIDYEMFVVDENREFFRVMAKNSVNKQNYFNLLLVDKNSFEIYSSKPKNNCSEAYKSLLEKNYNDKEFDLLLPFMFFYYQNRKDFELDTFLTKKYYAFERPNSQIEFRIVEKVVFKGLETYKIYQTVNKQEKGVLYIQSEAPHILIYYEGDDSILEFREEIEEEFDEEKFNCFGD